MSSESRVLEKEILLQVKKLKSLATVCELFIITQ